MDETIVKELLRKCQDLRKKELLRKCQDLRKVELSLASFRKFD